MRTHDDFVLTTDRLGLRPHRLDDAAFMVELNRDPEVVRYTGDRAFERIDEAEAVIRSLMRQHAERRLGRFLVLERESGRRLGFCGLRWFDDTGEVDLGYRLLREAWGRGLATEAARACLAYGFQEIGLGRIVARAARENPASLRVLEKLGFTPIGEELDAGLVFVKLELSAPGPSPRR